MNNNTNVDYDKLIILIDSMTPEEIQFLAIVAQSILMEKNVLCGKGD